MLGILYSINICTILPNFSEFVDLIFQLSSLKEGSGTLEILRKGLRIMKLHEFPLPVFFLFFCLISIFLPVNLAHAGVDQWTAIGPGSVCVWSIAIIPANPEEQSPKSKVDGRPWQLAEKASVSMRVLWTISEYKVSEGAVWGEEEARKLLFKPLDINATKITFDGRTCQDVIFEKGTVNATEYLADRYRTTPQALDIKEELIEVVKTNCRLTGFAEYIRLKDRRLIIHLNGVFFYFRPSVNY